MEDLKTSLEFDVLELIELKHALKHRITAEQALVDAGQHRGVKLQRIKELKQKIDDALRSLD